MGVEMGAGGGVIPSLDFEIIRKKVVFSISRGRKQISSVLSSPLEKNLGKYPSGPPGKNPSDAHGCRMRYRLLVAYEKRTRTF